MVEYRTQALFYNRTQALLYNNKGKRPDTEYYTMGRTRFFIVV